MSAGGWRGGLFNPAQASSRWDSLSSHTREGAQCPTLVELHFLALLRTSLLPPASWCKMFPTSDTQKTFLPSLTLRRVSLPWLCGGCLSPRSLPWALLPRQTFWSPTRHSHALGCHTTSYVCEANHSISCHLLLSRRGCCLCGTLSAYRPVLAEARLARLDCVWHLESWLKGSSVRNCTIHQPLHII